MCNENTEKRFGWPILGQEILNAGSDEHHPGTDIIKDIIVNGLCQKVRTQGRPEAQTCWDFLNESKPKIKSGCDLSKDIRKIWLHKAKDCQRSWPPKVWFKI